MSLIAKEAIPDLPGVYKFLNAKGEVIYVGKARNLRKRVLSYFSKAEEPTCDYKTRTLVHYTANVEWIITETEWDALLLENNLIKHYKPRFNVLLKDGKTYPYLCITSEPYPRLLFLRQKLYSHAKYYGPFPGGGMLRTLLELFRTLYKLRDCDLKLSPEAVAAGRFRACVKYHIGTCAAPCIGKQSHEDYLSAVEEVSRLLEGEWELVLQEIDRQRQMAVQALEFERAHLLKKRMEQLRAYQQRSIVVDAAQGDIEVLSFAVGVRVGVAHHLSVRRGRIVASHTYQFVARDWELSPSEVLERVIGELAISQGNVASQILLDGWKQESPLPESDEYTFLLPSSPEWEELAALCRKTALNLAETKNAFLAGKAEKKLAVLRALQEVVGLPTLPRRIECIDNSHVQGSHLVSGVAVFVDGEPRRSEYRRYIHEGIPVGDDFAAMRAVIQRRYAKRLKEGTALPDVILIDGGKGQLSAAEETLRRLGLDIPLMAIAKKKEEIFLPGRKEPLYIDRRSPELRLLQRLRDEAHQTAVGFHRQRRDAATLHTMLLEVPGIGQKLANKLLQRFSSLENLRRAPISEIATLIGKKRAEKLYNYLQDVGT
ncbi:MAG: excinuclease ABC subunit UvrC [Bacteroidia bacterium]|nr:excinuclease ABC subunit UvrC [Bacteroidia bacterium]MDW8133762.1 excinuclease ABC subunit UvrC [Bacteroidia bacterium]